MSVEGNEPTIDKSLYPDQVVRQVNHMIEYARATGEKVAHWEAIQEYLFF